MDDDSAMVPGTRTRNCFRYTPVGALVDGVPTYDDWYAEISRLLDDARATPWRVGDMLNIGEARWGEMYAQAVEATGRAYFTLAGWKRVAAAVPIEERREDIPYSYYKLVAHLPPEVRAGYLALAASGEVENSTELAQRLKADRNGREPMEEPDMPDCPCCGERLEPRKAEIGRCRACGAGVVEMARLWERARASVGRFLETGDLAELEPFR